MVYVFQVVGAESAHQFPERRMSSHAQWIDPRVAEIEASALALPAAERAQLAARLLSSLDEDAAVERAWDLEIRRRLEDLRAGRMKVRPAEEALAELEARVR
jgi:putative addiction module component (TIGR02574 family)